MSKYKYALCICTIRAFFNRSMFFSKNTFSAFPVPPKNPEREIESKQRERETERQKDRGRKRAKIKFSAT